MIVPIFKKKRKYKDKYALSLVLVWHDVLVNAILGHVDLRLFMHLTEMKFNYVH